METILIIAIAAIVSIVIIFLSYLVIRWRLETRFRHWLEIERQTLEQERSKIRKEAVVQSRAVLGGKFVEQMAPYLPEFKYDPTEARFIGSPIDLVVFPGLAAGDPKEIVIMEIKTGQGCQLTREERKIRQLIEEGMVRWELIEREGQAGKE